MEERNESRLPTGLRAHFRLLAFYLGSRTIALDVLPADFDYSPVFDEPSALEQAFAIWANVVTTDRDGSPTNAEAAQRRMAQYIRSFLDTAYVVVPPFEDWELELAI